MKSFTLASFAVIAALTSASSAFAVPNLNCQLYQGNWVSAPPSSCPTPEFGGNHTQIHVQHSTEVKEVDAKY